MITRHQRGPGHRIASLRAVLTAARVFRRGDAEIAEGRNELRPYRQPLAIFTASLGGHPVDPLSLAKRRNW
jgi:hypothetical protein